MRKEVNRSKYRGMIVVGNMDSLKYRNTSEKVDRFGSQNYYHYDGIHMMGRYGKQLHTECVTAAIRATASIPVRKQTAQPTPISTHETTTYPAADRYIPAFLPSHPPPGHFTTPKKTVREKQANQTNPTITQNKFEVLN